MMHAYIESKPLLLGLTVAFVFTMLTSVSSVSAGHATGVNNIAPDADFVEELPFVAKRGDRFKVSYDYSFDHRSNGRISVHKQIREVADGEILEQNSDGYIIQCTLREYWVEINDRSSFAFRVNARLVNALKQSFLNKPHMFEANRAGHPILVPNWKANNVSKIKALKDHLPDLLEEFMPEHIITLSNSGRLHLLLERLSEPDTGWTYKDGKAEADEADVAALVAAVQNIALPRLGKFEWKHAAPVIGNKDNIRTKTIVWFENFNRQIDTAEIRWRTEFDTDDLKNSQLYKDRMDVIVDAVKSSGMHQITPDEILESANEHLQLERIDEGFARIRISDGWTQEATYEMRVNWSVAGAKSSEVEKHGVRVKRLPSI